jgi:hypothetical protein
MEPTERQEPDQQKRRSRLGCLSLVGVALGGVAIYAGHWYLYPDSAAMLSYWVDDSRHLGVYAYAGPANACWIDRTVETSIQVQVFAACRGPIIQGPTTANLVGYELGVSLAAPLENRDVIDGLEQRAMFCRNPRCQ